MKSTLRDILISAAVFVVSAAAAGSGYYYLSGFLLMALAAGLFLESVMMSGRLFGPAAFFSLSWIGGAGISALKLSALQSDWSIVTWMVIYLAYACFRAGHAAYTVYADTNAGRSCECTGGGSGTGGAGSVYDDKRANSGKEASGEEPERAYTKGTDDGHVSGTLTEPETLYRAEGLLIAINIVTFLSLAAFIVEAGVLGYIPLFTSDTPHAYSYFHISGVHYFTVSCVLVLPLIMLYLGLYVKGSDRGSGPGLAGTADLALCAVISFLLPILMVSRYELIMTLGLSVLTLATAVGWRLPGHLDLRKAAVLAAGCAAFLLLYIFITYERAHSVEYLNGIYEMKDPGMPIFISQPYIYIANNYDNLNCLVEALCPEAPTVREIVQEIMSGGTLTWALSTAAGETGTVASDAGAAAGAAVGIAEATAGAEEAVTAVHSMGLRMLFPVFALTGLKFRYADLISFPLYVTKEELTTVSLVYDAFYDFGVTGAAVFALVLGAAAALLERANQVPRPDRPMLSFAYAQVLFYLALSFFTTWFSNATTWFYIIATAAMGVFIRVYVCFRRRRRPG